MKGRTAFASVWVLALAIALVVAACTGSTPEASPTPTVVRASVPSSSPEAPPLVKTATTDIQSYWSKEFPVLYGGRMYTPIPVDRIYAAGTPGVDIPPCQGHVVTSAVWTDNAFYCFKSDYVVYDARSSGLIRDIQRRYGDLAVGMVFAHEWGHAIQDRSGNANQPSIYSELQADCFAGAWIASVRDGQDPGLTFQAGDLDGILTTMLSLRDVPGASPRAASAHGSGFDRVSAFQDGFDTGPQACARYFAHPPFISESAFTTLREYDSGGNLAAAKVLPVSVELLNNFYSLVARKVYQPIPLQKVYAYDATKTTHNLPTCAGAAVVTDQIENRVFFCPSDGFVILDINYLQGIYDSIGDFGVSTLLAVPWGVYVQGLQGAEITDTGSFQTSPRADCYTGGFAAAMVNGALSSKALGGTVSLSPGDLDEAISAFIDADQVAGDIGTDVTFARVDAFRDGFLRGYPYCHTYPATPLAASSTPPAASAAPSMTSSPTTSP